MWSLSIERWCLVTRPRSASRSAACFFLAWPCARSASRSGSSSPSMSALTIARALADDARKDTVELDVRVLEHLLDSHRVLRHFADQLLAGSREVAQFLDRSRRYEAAANQAVREQIGDPHRVVHVGLAAGNVANVLRVREHEIEAALEQVPHWFPVHARR